MLDLYYPDVSDKNWATECLSKSNYMGCEYSFGNIIMWTPVFKTKIAKYKNFLITKGEGEKPSYCCPAGDGDVTEVIFDLIEDARQCGHPFRMVGLSAECVKMMEQRFPGRFIFTPYRDSFDYIYNTEDLINLSGRKYHGKRNHISAFKNNNNWSLELINEDNLNECIELNNVWEEENREKDPESIAMEQAAIKRGFDNYFELDFLGAVLRVDGKPVAFTIGERMSDEMFCIHFEKAVYNIRGAYPMINREFAERALSGYKYINREDDAGSEGLRKAKLSYYPAILLEKYILELRD
ncbi:MAG: DUF2156 domain-containing protein [Acutalibacteraceae bacterium]|jgi:hypothetical protein